MNRRYFLTSESVTEGHPDKVCDFISDSILDAYLSQDRDSRVGVETLISNKKVIIAGQVTSNASIDIENIVNNKLKQLDYEKCDIDVFITKQSYDIARGVNSGGAGDQGILVGYATNETKNYMPYSTNIAHGLAKRLADARKNGKIPYLKPDGKVQVTVEYTNNLPIRIDSIVISAQHESEVDIKKLKNDIIELVINDVIKTEMIDSKTKLFINPTGRFVIGGSIADTGLTGRKIIVDSYGTAVGHGGGAFSGKDPTKIDRSGAYMLRHIAKSIVASGLAKRCELQMSYAIGIPEPLSIYINCFGTNKKSEDIIIKEIKSIFDLTPNGIINYLNLKEPIYEKTSNYGHFGKEGFTWEKIRKMS